MRINEPSRAGAAAAVTGLAGRAITIRWWPPPAARTSGPGSPARAKTAPFRRRPARPRTGGPPPAKPPIPARTPRGPRAVLRSPPPVVKLLLFTSRAWTVMVEVLEPLATIDVGLALIIECAAFATPGLTVNVPLTPVLPLPA